MQNGVEYSRTPGGQASITVDTGRLPAWPVMQAMNVAYSEAVVRLQNALSLTELMNLPEFGYRFHVVNPVTSERRVMVQRGGEDQREAAVVSWPIAVSMLAILRLKDYTATYGESNVIGLFFSFGGDSQVASDMDRMMLLFEERPEFSMFNLSHDLEVSTDDTKGEEEED